MVKHEFVIKNIFSTENVLKRQVLSQERSFKTNLTGRTIFIELTCLSIFLNRPDIIHDEACTDPNQPCYEKKHYWHTSVEVNREQNLQFYNSMVLRLVYDLQGIKISQENPYAEERLKLTKIQQAIIG